METITSWVKIFAVIFLTSMFISATSASQQFTVEPEDQCAATGDTTTLKCSVSGRTGKVQWSKDGFAMGYGPLLSYDPRYSMAKAGDNSVPVDSSSEEFDLVINNTQLEDQDPFTCTVSGVGENPLQTSAILSVNDGGAQRFTVEPADTTVNQGGRTVLHCSVGNRLGNVQWAKDGFAFGYSNLPLEYRARYSMSKPGDAPPPGGASTEVFDLLIVDVNLKDRGKFECFVEGSDDNKCADKLRAAATLRVKASDGENIQPSGVILVASILTWLILNALRN